MIGIYVENRLAIGTLIVRVIAAREADELIRNLRQAGYGVTSLDAQGATGRVHLIYTIIRRRDLDPVLKTILAFNSRSFVSVEEIQSASQGIFPVKRAQSRRYSDGLDVGTKRK